MSVPFVPIGPAGAQVELSDIVRFRNSGSDRSIYLVGSDLRDVVDVHELTGGLVELGSLGTPTVRNLTSPSTKAGQATARVSEQHVIDILVENITAVEGDVLELEFPVEAPSGMFYHRRLFTATLGLSLTALQIKQFLDIVEADHFIVPEGGTLIHYLVRKGSGDHATGDVLVKQHLYDLNGNPINLSQPFIARSISGP